MNDHYRFFELQNNIKMSGYMAASMLQQLSNAKTIKQLTKNDLARITYASSLNFFHTKSMFDPWPFGIYICIDYIYVKRINSENYQYQLIWLATNAGNSPNTMYYGIDNVLSTKTKTEVAAINSNLVCNKDGDERVLLISWYRKQPGFDKKKLGLWMLNPKESDIYATIFKYKLVITPKPGLFPVVNP